MSPERIFMEPADFAVRIEEVMGEECSSYECVLLDEEEIGILWSFVIEESISGYIGIDENEDTFKMRTVTLGLHLKEITGASREELIEIFGMNNELMNANLSVVQLPARPQEEQGDEEVPYADEGEDMVFEDEEDDEANGDREILVIQTRLPFDAFDPDDFQGFVSNLIFQADLFLNRDEDPDDLDSDDISEDDFEE